MDKSHMHQDLAFDDYLQLSGRINATALKGAMTSYKHMHHLITGERPEQTEAMKRGRLFHSVLEEGEGFFDRIVLFTGKVRRGKEWEAFKEENQGKHILVPKEVDDLSAAYLAFQKIPKLDEVLSDNPTHEPSFLWSDERYGQAKARPDILNEDDAIIEYKTTGSINKYAFTNRAYKLGYHFQLGWAAEAMVAMYGVLPTIYFIVQENKAPFDGYVLRVPSSIVEWAMKLSIDCAIQYRKYERQGHFPGHLEEITDYELPGYVAEPWEEEWTGEE